MICLIVFLPIRRSPSLSMNVVMWENITPLNSVFGCDKVYCSDTNINANLMSVISTCHFENMSFTFSALESSKIFMQYLEN